MFRLVIVLAAVAAAANAYVATGYGGVIAPSITSQGSNIHRSFGNLGQVATQQKSIITPYSSVHKSDVRVSNPGLAVHGYAAPAYHAAAYAAPAYAAPAYHAPAYAAPAYAGYHGGAVVKAAVPAAGLLGVAYSAAPVVSHMSYTSGLGFNYAW